MPERKASRSRMGHQRTSSDSGLSITRSSYSLRGWRGAGHGSRTSRGSCEDTSQSGSTVLAPEVHVTPNRSGDDGAESDSVASHMGLDAEPAGLGGDAADAAGHAAEVQLGLGNDLKLGEIPKAALGLAADSGEVRLLDGAVMYPVAELQNLPVARPSGPYVAAMGINGCVLKTCTI